MRRSYFTATFLGLLVSATAAFAGPLTGPVDSLSNTTQVIGSDGGVTESSNGQYSYIGDNYNTSGMSVYATNTSDGVGNGGWLTDPHASYSINLALNTTFDGHDTLSVNGQTINVGYSDIFIGVPGSSTAFAVTLGGNMAPGLYTVGGAKTSQQTMGGYSGISYGAGYTTKNGGLVSPVDVLLTSGSALPGHVTDTYSNGILDVSVTGLNEDEIAALSKDFSFQWGTGWCANGAMFIGDVAIPEPVGMSFLMFGLVAVCYIVSRRHPLKVETVPFTG